MHTHTHTQKSNQTHFQYHFLFLVKMKTENNQTKHSYFIFCKSSMLLDRALACLGNRALRIYSQNLRQTSLKETQVALLDLGRIKCSP